MSQEVIGASEKVSGAAEPASAAEMRQAIIRTQDLHKHYGEVKAVNGVTFSVVEGETFGFLGPNGAGKTTTIKMLITLVKPTSGLAFVDGLDVTRHQNEVRKRIGYVAQEVGLDGRATARENLELVGHYYNLPRKVVRERAQELLELMDLAKEADKLVGTFSGGMRKRLDIATGLMHRPRVLFLDEPTVGLDPQTRAYIWEYIRRLNKEQGITLFLTTHYLEEADQLCDRVAIIDHGAIRALGTPLQLKQEISGDAVVLSLGRGDGRHDPALLKAGRAALEGQSFVREIQTSAEQLMVYVEKGDVAVPLILRQLDAAGVPVETISIKRPSLDDVFLKYTGRTIREEEAQKLTWGGGMRRVWGGGGRRF